MRHPAPPETAPPHWAAQRRHELDWLRVLAFGLLILYHLGMAYVVDWSWHIKSLHQSEFLQYPMLWSSQWRMSLLFMISGAAVSYQLHRHSGWTFITASARKLLLPLVFGSLVIVAPQAFVESRMAGAIDDMGYGEFWWRYLGPGGPLPPVYARAEGQNLTWNHLWFLPYLFAYVLLLWLAYPLLRQEAVTRRAEQLAQRMPVALLYLLPVALFFGIGEWLWPRYPSTHALVDDWYNHARYFAVFILGFGLVRSNRLWQAIRDLRHLSLALATAACIGIMFYFRSGELATYLPMLAPLEGALRGLVWSANAWLWIMAILGYAQAWLDRPSPTLRSANAAVYCWYILHQTLIVVGIYALRNQHLGPVLEPLTVAALTVAGCALGYRLVSGIPGLRVLFGVSAKKMDKTPGVETKKQSP